ncbi:uncharacterized protein CLUP02_04132 [Colletotrichum lupini]|uniref:Uncharacterized protein n=1 Tax=Colletotrichum lupini TaxID=145971 RepID=A0A9Q8SKM6_9PEZI|nr:uncharacterized protein CLUP02_04132 [Colletotrichum lupini]UQC78655.1 hypothetical protein CLUP02_04132 [Colletotrichum lupini]
MRRYTQKHKSSSVPDNQEPLDQNTRQKSASLVLLFGCSTTQEACSAKKRNACDTATFNRGPGAKLSAKTWGALKQDVSYISRRRKYDSVRGPDPGSAESSAEPKVEIYPAAPRATSRDRYLFCHTASIPCIKCGPPVRPVAAPGDLETDEEQQPFRSHVRQRDRSPALKRIWEQQTFVTSSVSELRSEPHGLGLGPGVTAVSSAPGLLAAKPHCREKTTGPASNPVRRPLFSLISHPSPNSHESPRGRVAEAIFQQAENLDREPHTIGRKSRTNWQREESLAAFNIHRDQQIHNQSPISVPRNPDPNERKNEKTSSRGSAMSPVAHQPWQPTTSHTMAPWSVGLNDRSNGTPRRQARLRKCENQERRTAEPLGAPPDGRMLEGREKAAM